MISEKLFEQATRAKAICNAFSLQMLKHFNVNIMIDEIDEDQFNRLRQYNIPSAIGHADTARVLNLECNRVNVKLNDFDCIIVVQLMGGRLPEGATTLPEGFSFKYLIVRTYPSDI